jgi:hypothetical protein
MTDRTDPRDLLGARHTRRTVAGAAALSPLAALGLSRAALAQDDETDDDTGITSTGTGDVPTTGGMRPGPGGERPVPASGSGVTPVAMVMDRFSIDYEVYPSEIIDQAMQDPTGPFVIAWYPTLGALGRNGNVVVAGHVDYWNVGPAVFYGFKDPGANPGDQITLVGEDGSRHVYEVQTSRTYENGSLTPDVIEREIAGATRLPTLTIITCGGVFDTVSGEYLSRIVVRANRVSVEPATA